MDNILNSILTILISSSILSSLITFILQKIFESGLKHHFEKELEEQRHTYNRMLEDLRHSYEMELEIVRTKLSIGANTANELTERRLTLYPKIVELVYRSRNISKYATNEHNYKIVVSDEMATKAKELEDELYRCRMDLERDNVFVPIHTYKNALKTFIQLYDEYGYCQGNDGRHDLYERINELYKEIEILYKSIIKIISCDSLLSKEE